MTDLVLLAGEFTREGDPEVTRALRSLDGRCARVTIAVVAVPQRLLCYGMPFCGAALIEQVHDGAERESQRRACEIARRMCPRLCVEHLVVTGWQELVRHARRRGYDEVLVADEPSHLRDRLLLRRAGWAVGDQVVLTASSSSSGSPNVSTNAISSTGRLRSFLGKPRSG
jgi:hypothetical protein